MPIIPRYNLSQTSTLVRIEVSIPHVRVSTSTLDLVIVDGTELHLHAPPTYLLKLTLPGRVVGEDEVEESLACAATAGGSDVVRVVEDGENYIEAGASSSTAAATVDATADATAARLWTEEDLPKLQYDPEKNHGTLVVVLSKEEEGLWDDLDLLGRLQQPAPQQRRQKQESRSVGAGNGPLVQEIDANGEGEIEGYQNGLSESELMEDLLSIDQKRPVYGLFGHFSNVFRDYAREGLTHDMLECPNPDEAYARGDCGDEHLEQQSRREMRLEVENEKFDPDRYLNDLSVEEEGDMIFDSAMAMVPHWMEKGASQVADESIEDITDRLSKLSAEDGNQSAFFTPEESHLLATTPAPKNVPVRLTPEQKRAALLSLTDILFAYAYDHRTTDGDPTVESSWTVMILSPSLSWLESYNPPYDSLVDVIGWCVRRSLIYPYLRTHALAMKVVQDVCRIIGRGRRTVIRCLLQVHGITERSESHYLFNKLYVDPLIWWMQRCKESEVREFGREMECLLVRTEKSGDMGDNVEGADDPYLLGKESMGLCLVELERSLFESYEDEESSSSDDGDESLDYQSDSDSRGVDEDTVGMTTTDEEGLSACNQSMGMEVVPKAEKTSGKASANRVSAALLDENIGFTKSDSSCAKVDSEVTTGSARSEKRLIEEA